MPRVVKFIRSAGERQLTYKNRMRSLVTKISELAALCDADILFTGINPETGGVTTWPEDSAANKKVAKRIRRTPRHRIRDNFNIRTYLQDELDKELCRLVKVKQRRHGDQLPLGDPHLDDLPDNEITALHHAMGEKLERGRRQMAELGSVDVVAASAVAVTAPALQNAPAFDLNLPVATSSVGAQEQYCLPSDVLTPPLFPVQSPYIDFQFQMQHPCIAFGGPPMPFMPIPMAAPPGFSFSGHMPAPTAGFYRDFPMQGPGQGFVAGVTPMYRQDASPAVAYNLPMYRQDAGPAVAYHHEDFRAYNFDAAGTGVGYELEHRAARVWPMRTLNDPVGTAAYQLENGTVLWPYNGWQANKRSRVGCNCLTCGDV